MSKHLPILGGHVTGFGATHRNDDWWVGPGLTLTGLLAFIIYVHWAIFQAEHYYVEPYLSPLYSPVLFSETSAAGSAPLEHAWFGAWPTWWPSFLPPSPAMLILVFPALFRFTCYYYRKAYYRAFAGSPPACAVGPLRAGKPYKGETSLFLFQNLHRYALYAALCYIVILYYDSFIAFWKDGQFGVGVGTIILLVNATLIAGYTFGCHSFRHLVGGHDDCMSCGEDSLKLGAWKKATWFNMRHMQWAWASLVWVMWTDVYIRLVSAGILTDLNTWD